MASAGYATAATHHDTANMPTKPRHFCNWMGPAGARCNELTAYRFCNTHRNDYDRTRRKLNPKDRNFYGTEYWRRIRDEQLDEYPFCQWPVDEGQCNKLATDVDHIIERKRGGSDAPSNRQSLCHAHHSSKTMSENIHGAYTHPTPEQDSTSAD